MGRWQWRARVKKFGPAADPEALHREVDAFVDELKKAEADLNKRDDIYVSSRREREDEVKFYPVEDGARVVALVTYYSYEVGPD